MTVPTDPQALARACADAMWADDLSTQALGMAIEHIAPGQARMAMEVTAAMTNGHGICHGGYIFTLADSAFAFACNTYNERVVAQHCSITYLRPGRRGMRLVANAIERSRSGRSGIYDVTVSADEHVIAEFRGHSRSLGRKFFEDDAP
ncbi:MAG: hydroxyphenylacetyl-CoA thioesterase PaaI [Rhodospirillales bacterium]|nr:hydroxyphenylacetyl-CoA thioesterase PaaI [Rhodospirillales bacterium]MDE2198464.1 hydroxyphenylacetyl-CoA thioesterase PaaI [Rhodospirillales bacterium]